MMRSMYSGVVGLRVHQTRMDVIGNNVANVNTIGFKANRVTFADLFSQTLRGGSGSGASMGGTNPVQIGPGVTVTGINTRMETGTLQFTGRSTDLAIEGDGFFIVSQGGQNFFTRAGAFGIDSAGYLTDPSGFLVQGWTADEGGRLPAPDRVGLGAIKIAAGTSVLPSATNMIRLGHVLDSRSEKNAVHTTSARVVDSQGNHHEITIKFEKTDDNKWAVTFFNVGNTGLNVSADGRSGDTAGKVQVNGANTIELEFSADGALIQQEDGGQKVPAYGSIVLPVENTGQGEQMTINIDFSALQQVAVPGGSGSTVEPVYVDGFQLGMLSGVTIDDRGVVFGVFTNGERQALARVAVAAFANPEGLMKVGGNLFVTSANSGVEQIGEPGVAGRGKIAPANLEMSNVDLADEFTDMIVSQRGFQANSRIISVVDEMLQDLIHLKR